MNDDTAEIKKGQDRYRELQRQAAAGEKKRFEGEPKFGRRKSFSIFPHLILRDEALTYQEKLISVDLFYHAWGKDECWPGIKTIIKETGLGRVAVFKALKSLNHKGWIETQKAGGCVNRYRLLKTEKTL